MNSILLIPLRKRPKLVVYYLRKRMVERLMYNIVLEEDEFTLPVCGISLSKILKQFPKIKSVYCGNDGDYK